MRFWWSLIIREGPCRICSQKIDDDKLKVPEMLEAGKCQKSGPKVTVPLRVYEAEDILSGDEEDVFVEKDSEEGTSQEDDAVEQGFTDLVDTESELFMELERDRHNTPICKLIPTTASGLQWNCFTGQSITRKYKK